MLNDQCGMVRLSGEGGTVRQALDSHAKEGCRTSLQIVQLKKFENKSFSRNEFVLTADVPGFTADKCEKISRAMHDSKNEDFVVLHEIDDTIASEDQFSEV
jgi:hypothetical protein